MVCARDCGNGCFARPSACEDRPGTGSGLVQSWVVRHLQILGEAVRGLSPELRAQHEEVPWSEIVGMRNILVHDYFDIDQDIVWSVVEHDLSGLKLSLERILAGLPTGEGEA
jgi:uncharacterized protein with HEPN domain